MSGSQTTVTAGHGGNIFLRVVGAISSICGVIAALLILGAILVTCQMLYQRYWLGESTIWQTETVTFMMVAATLIGLPYVQRLRGHVNVDLIPMMLPVGLRKALLILVLVTSLVVMGMMVWYGYEMWHVAWERGWTTDSVWGPKLANIYIFVPVGLGLYTLQMFADLLAVFLGISDDGPQASADGGDT